MMKDRGRFRFGAVLVSAALLGGGGLYLTDDRNFPEERLEVSAYVWQRAWSPAVVEAVERSAPQVDHYMVLAAEANPGQDSFGWAHARVDWSVFQGCSVEPVLRIGVGAAGWLDDGKRSAFVEELVRQTRDVQRAISDAGASHAGVQLDFDCPTAHLGAYRELIVELRDALDGLPVSITTLPTWMTSDAFEPLVRATESFVLQVHSLEKPDTIDDEIALVSSDRVMGYIRAAEAMGTPWRLALPTYGYRLLYEPDGEFAALVAEQRYAASGAGYLERRIASSPVSMAALVNHLNANPPENCRGIAWFRMPVTGDALNWPWPTFRAVIEGRMPSVDVRARLENPKPGLYEVWVDNRGECTPNASAAVWLNELPGLVGYDTFSGYVWRFEDGDYRVIGAAPPVGESRRVAWFRTESPVEPEIQFAFDEGSAS